jgi:hypothetical protein
VYESRLNLSNNKSFLNKADESIKNTLASSGNYELLEGWEKLKGNATAAWENTKDIFQDSVEDISNFVSDKSTAVSKFITETTDQLNVKTDTFKVVKDVYKDYRKQGIDINQFDVENYTSKYGTSEFADKINSSTMVDADKYPNGVFWTEKEANISYASEANPITIDDNRETGNILIKVPVTFEDETGEEYVVNMYTKDNIFEGMQGNIVAGTAARIAAYSMDPFNPIPISVTHTHPEDAKDNSFSKGFRDELVAKWPTVKKMYMTDVGTGKMFVFSENTPWNDADTDYEIEIPIDNPLPNTKTNTP